MNSKDKGVSGNTGKSSIAVILYVAAAVVALFGVALLIDNIYIFKTTIDQYIAQGYPAADVAKSLVPAQLLPGIFEPVAVYGGIALILFGIGKTDKKLSKCLATLPKAESSEENDEAEPVKPDETDSENPTIIKPEDTDLL
jgi:hypothetical protein